MTVSLYDISVRTYLQTIKAVSRFLDKGRLHLEQEGQDLEEIVDARLYPDMLPFRFQIVSIVQHSLGTMAALQDGRFRPPRAEEQDYAALQALVADAVSGLKALQPDAIDALADKEIIFQLGEMKLPFKSQDFVLSFSLPNFYFHATTAYDILRMRGVPLGKADFMGPLRFKR